MKAVKMYRIKGAIGIILILSAVGMIFYWENYGREAFLYEEIIVARKDIYTSDMITWDSIMTSKIEKKMVSKDTVLHADQIIGKESKQFIPCNMPIDYRYLDEPSLVLGEDEYIFKIPNDWIVAFPGSLRRGDSAFFYPILEDVVEEKSEEYALEAIPMEITIAYVKDSANREVTNIKGDTLERFDGTSNINAIEVITTLEKTQALNQYIDKGYRFLILYRSR